MSSTDSAAPADGAEYDPFEEFNRSAGIGVVENPYPIFAMIRAEHTIKKEDLGDALLPDDVDASEVALLNSDPPRPDPARGPLTTCISGTRPRVTRGSTAARPWSSRSPWPTATASLAADR